MRLIDMRHKDINESRGFAARRPGTEYVDTKNRSDVATFGGLTLLPSEEIAYKTHDEMLEAFDIWRNEASGQVYNINNPNRSMHAVMIVNMDTQRGPEHYVLFTKDLGRLDGKLTNIPPGVIPGHGGYVMNREVSLSERSGLKPSEVLTSSRAVSPNQVPNLLNAAKATAGDEPVEQMQQYLQALLAGKGTNYVIKDGATHAKLHSKYLGEWASPIALITGQFNPASQYSELQDTLAGGASLSDALIKYSTGVADALIDSTVVGTGYEIGISSKASTGGGAAASLKGLEDTMAKQADKFPPGFWEDPKNQQFKHVVDTIMRNSSIDGPLELAVERKILSSADATALKQGLNPATKKGWKPNNNLTAIMDSYDARDTHPDYDPAKHAFAATAKRLVDQLNDEDYTSTVKQVLNHATMVQMYFKTTVQGQDLVCKGFDLVWPPRFDGTIKFNSGKNLSATEIKGRIGFKIGKGAALIDDPDASLTVPISDREVATQRARKTAKAQRDVGRIVEPGQRDVRDPNVPDVVALGRQKKR